MGSTVFIVWRESIEAMLVIGILYTWLKNQADTGNGMRFLWGGVLAGILLAIGLAFVMLEVQSELAGEALEYFQIAIMLVAAVLITQMVLWMRRHGRTLKRELESGMQRAHEQANWWGMAVLAAIAVGREGAETVIFLYGAGLAQSSDSQLQFVGAALSGFVLAFVSFWILSQGSRFFSWKVFFHFSEILLLLLAAALLVDGVDRMIGLGWIPALVDPVWDSSFLLDDSTRIGGLISAFTGYRAHPALTLLVIYAAYWTVVSLLLRQPKALHIHAAER
ncbi:High-affinity iron permease [hydrothermal vent metagenome]|uniref:High-affinity iron permease n=1 Tax=hydrothermal vent metagenome TaxID=652676 RepID=A0A3B1BT34_9ZZZZ